MRLVNASGQKPRRFLFFFLLLCLLLLLLLLSRFFLLYVSFLRSFSGLMVASLMADAIMLGSRP